MEWAIKDAPLPSTSALSVKAAPPSSSIHSSLFSNTLIQGALYPVRVWQRSHCNLKRWHFVGLERKNTAEIHFSLTHQTMLISVLLKMNHPSLKTKLRCEVCTLKMLRLQWKRSVLEADNCAPCCFASFFSIFNYHPREQKKCFPPYWQTVYGEPTSQVELSYASKIVHLNTGVKGTRLSFAKCSVLTQFLGGWGPPTSPLRKACPLLGCEVWVSSSEWASCYVWRCAYLLIVHPQSLKRRENVAAAPLGLSRRKENRSI